MHRERVSENVYWFRSEVYAQVTAGAVTGPQWAVMIDTLALPEEAQEMRDFIEDQLGVPVRYVINTHYHADHSWGNCFFPNATVIAHSLARETLLDKGENSLNMLKKQNAAFRNVKLVPPNLTFSEGSLTLRVGKKTLIMSATPGHSFDGISVLVEEDRVLFAGDAFMPLPYMVDGDPDDLAASIKRISKMGLENIVQGHGDIILRGEIEEATRSNLAYINNVRKAVRSASKKRDPLGALAEIDIESCGKSRVTLGGLGVELHKRNVVFLYKTLTAEETEAELA
ncbi:MAG: MBL fold metallo-hydrolase [Anaerolineaceae bacterium]|nr:MBL fold metallo-hydrolase [Anaerolineaceae bacterium]